MNFIDPALENYCVKASSTPSALCEELAEYTRTHVAMSVMLCGPLVAASLRLLIASTGAKRVVEVGCYTGYSALAMAEILPADGIVETFDTNPETLAIARRFWDRSAHASKIRGTCGDTAQSLKTLSGPIDFAFLDANKVGYQAYFERLWPLIRPGGMIAADNCLYEGQVILNPPPEENARAILRYNTYVTGLADATSLLLPVRDGVMIALKK